MVELLTNRERQLNGLLRYLRRKESKRNRSILESEIQSFACDKDYHPHDNEQMRRYFDVNGTKGILD